MLLKASYGFYSTLDSDVAFDLHDFDKEKQSIKIPKKLYSFILDYEYFLNEEFSFSINISRAKSLIESEYELIEYDFYSPISSTKYYEDLTYTNNQIYLICNYHFDDILQNIDLFNPFGGTNYQNQNSLVKDRFDMYISGGLGLRKLNYFFASTNPNSINPEFSRRFPIRILCTFGFNFEITHNFALNFNAFMGNSVFFRTGIAYKILQE